MKQIKDFPNYSITKEGIVFTKRRPKVAGGILKSYLYPSGYFGVRLSKNGKHYNKTIHRLLLETFVGSCPSGMQCRHLDGNKQNNGLGNLCWGTHSENQQDRVRHGTDNNGEKNPASKLTEEDVKEIRKRYKTKYISQRKLAKEFGISQTQIGRIINDTSWKYLRR